MKSHDYQKFAKEYSQLGITDTFYLGFRDLPGLIKKYVKGRKALDFGCGSGRSTRFLKSIGFHVVGVDISREMIEKARKMDPKGTYLELKGHKILCKEGLFGLVLLFVVLMEIPSKEKMKTIFLDLKKVIKKNGILIAVTDAENAWKHDCSSFIYDFPENKNIKSGMQVKVKFRRTGITFYDYYWTEKDYVEVFSHTGFRLLELHKPLATGKEPFLWHSETKYPHFAIYVLMNV